MALKISKLVSVMVLSDLARGLRRGLRAAGRRLSGRRAEVLYFHQPDDPYSS